MEMESTRRPTFDRSREPGLKKARLDSESVAVEEANPNGRAYSSRAPSGTASISSGSGRYWAGNESGSDSGSGRAEAYQPQSQPQLYHELVCQYKAALAELTFNSKPIITNLTIIAGENLHAAKAVAATICSNIIEVPCDQKLPSLYLLDSIVKNIGREYIRYFSARLPEVFCKAYRQIDPSLHQSMRHLFGTWKGVFPPQTLQVIEKELGFTASLSNSGGSSRPDSQAQRPQQSIHVNPKYLERQRLNSRVKGAASDGSLSASSSANDRERLDKEPGSDVGRPWVNKINPSQREVLHKQMNEKKVAIHGDVGYPSDLSRNSSLGIEKISGKAVEQPLRGRSWFSGSSSVKETTSVQMNGFPVKHGNLNHPTGKSSRANVQLQSNTGVLSKSIGKNTSWKNSEEEEFLWDMHSRVSDHDATKGSAMLRKAIWVSDDSEKLDLDDLSKSRRLRDAGSRFDRESSSDSLSIEQKDVAFGSQLPYPWIQASLQGEKLVDSEIAVPGITYTEDYPSTFATSGGKLPSRPLSGLSQSGNPGFEFSEAAVPEPIGMVVQSRALQLPSVTHQTQLSSHSADQNFAQSHSYSVADNKTLHGPGNRQRKLLKLSTEDLKVSSSPPVQPCLPGSGSIEPSRKPSTSSLLSAVIESGILAKFNTSSEDGRHVQLGSQQSLAQTLGPSQVVASVGKLDSKSLIENHCQDDRSSDGMSGGKPSFSRIPDTAPSPISDLLSSLVSKGLISASNSEVSTLSSFQEPSTTLHSLVSRVTSNDAVSVTHDSSSSKPSPVAQNIVLSTVSVPPSLDVGNEESSSDSALKTSALVSPSIGSFKCESLIGLQFKPDVLRELHPHVLSAIFDNLAHQCSSCGVRLKAREQLDRHLLLHTTKDIMDDDIQRVSRNWYVGIDDWVSATTNGLPLDIQKSVSADEKGSHVAEDEPMIIADDNQFVCILCGELFEDYYNEEINAWMFKGARRMILPTDDASTNLEMKGPIIHATCSPAPLANTLELEHVKVEENVKVED